MLIMDLPIIYNFLIYKIWHPLFMDKFLEKLFPVFTIFHINSLILGGGFLIWDKFINSKIQKYRKEKSVKNLTSSKHEILIENEIQKKTQSSNKKNIIELNRRSFIKTTGIALGTGLIASKTLNAMNTTFDFIIINKKYRIPGLPENFKGLKIAFISDVHSSVYMQKPQMKKYVSEVMKLKADVIFVTGDFVNSKVSEVYPFAEVFTDLKAPMGVFGVTGNHDYYSGDIETVVKEIEQCGIKILRNENLSLERNGEKIHLLGIDDKYSKSVQEYVETGKTEIGAVENLIKGIPEVEKKILLCHKPYYFDDYAKLGMDLVLSGHTHGGQLVFAKFGNIPISFATIISKYVAGAYRTKSNPESLLYVNSGLAAVGIPVRLNCPPEISLITLG